MKNFLLPLLVAGLLFNAHFATGQVKTSASGPGGAAPKRTAVAKRAPVVHRPPPVDPTDGDNVDGEDLVIRRAAVNALGSIRGSVVVVDPATGRILTFVNQALGLKAGFIPCSTIKLVTSLAALSEHIVERDKVVYQSRTVGFNLTNAIAHSDNPYFSRLGIKLGFDRVAKYAQLLGLGEKAGLDIPGEQPGSVVPEAPKEGGVGLMTSFGTGVMMTPLELAALLSAIANNGTLYYLQYPRSADEVERFTPKVKRTLDDLAPNAIADIKVGMRAAVDFGTATRAGYNNEAIFGKTGTCTDFNSSSHMGWFGSFSEFGKRQLVVVVMEAAVTKTVSGGTAAAVAGSIYRTLSEQSYFAMDAPADNKSKLPQILVTMPCCKQQ